VIFPFCTKSFCDGPIPRPEESHWGGVSECDRGISAMRSLKPPGLSSHGKKHSPSPPSGIWNTVCYNCAPYHKNRRKVYCSSLHFIKIHVSSKRISMCMTYAIVCCLRMARIRWTTHLTCVVEIWTHLIVQGSRFCLEVPWCDVTVAWLLRVYELQTSYVEITLRF
jgi:hypothetical protein